MRLKTVILLFVAVIIAGGTAMLVRGWLDSERARLTAALPRNAGPDQPVVLPQILVAKTDLPVGHFVRPEDLVWQAWPQNAISPTYMVLGQRPLEDFVGSVVRSRTAAGEPIIDGRLISPKNSGFLAAVLPPGMRAVSLPVNPTTGVSGFVFPGDRVDLLLTLTVKVDNGNGERVDHKATETIMTDVRVLAIDQRLDNKPGEVVVASRVTFEVTPKQSEIVALVQEMGRLTLALRSLGTTEEETATVAAANEPGEQQMPARGGMTLDSEASRVVAPWGGRGNQRRITVVRGGKVDQRAVEGGGQ